MIKILQYTLGLSIIHDLISNMYIKNREDHEHNRRIHNNITDVINLFVATSVSVMHLYSSTILNGDAYSRVYGTTDIGKSALALHISLFIYELIYNVISERNVNMFIHHVFISWVFLSTYNNNFVLYYANIGGFAEITNIFLIPVTLIKRNEIYMDKVIYPGLGLFISFLFARISLLPYVFYLSLYDYSQINAEDRFKYRFGQSVLILVFCLSCYWFKKICSGFIKEYKKII